MRWSENETCQFVRLYLKNEFLWNSDHNEYKSKFKRTKAYNDIITEFRERTGISLNETELRIKIKNLRSTYSQEKNKIKQRLNAGCSYKPNMKWFDEWNKHFTKMKSYAEEISSFEDQQQDADSEDPCQKIWLTQSDDHIEVETLDNPFQESDSNYNIILKSEPREVCTIERSARYMNKKKKIKHRSPSTDYSDRTYRGSMDSTEVTKEDEFDIYGKYIATQLRKMDLQKALRVQLEIQGLVSEARISELVEKN